MKEHPNAELLRAIANGEQMQIGSKSTEFKNFSAEEALSAIADGRGCYIRVKPSTIIVNNIEVPEPMRDAPSKGTDYFFPSFMVGSMVTRDMWHGTELDFLLLKRGLCHFTREAAAAHAKAMLAPSMKEAT